MEILVIQREKRERLVFSQARVTVGRSPDNDLVLPYPTISRHHCCLESHRGLVIVVDLQSAGGTIINGKRVPEWVLLAPSEEVWFNICSLRVEDCLPPEKALVEEIARDPETPLDFLIRLGALAPGAFLQNPVLPLLLLEDPAYARKFPPKTLLALLGERSVPLPILISAARSTRWWIREVAAGHPGMPQEILEELLSDQVPEVRKRVMENPNRPAGALEKLLQNRK